MQQRSGQFSVATLMWVVFWVALHYWMFKLGALWAAFAIVLDKHVLVAYFCMKMHRNRTRTSS